MTSQEETNIHEVAKRLYRTHSTAGIREETHYSNLDYGSTHKTLIDRCLRNERKAQAEFYQLYSRAMYNVCLRMVRRSDVAEDILQNSFLDFFRKLDTFKREASVGAWLKRICINNCITHLKKRRHELVELDDRHAALADPSCHDDSVENGLSVSAVNSALMQLSDGYRTVFSLYCLEGYDHQEIAEILDITESTSKSQYSRAKARLRQILSEAVE